MKIAATHALWLILSVPVWGQATALVEDLQFVSSRVIDCDVPAGVSIVLIPNLHAPLKEITWGSGTGAEPRLSPLIDQWEINLGAPSDTARVLRIQLDADAQRTGDLTPIVPQADGGYMLPANLARVVGEKLRYEPQPWKNTVGYWVNANDYAYYLIDITEPGAWNLGILQGCGKDRGGSAAMVSVHGPIQEIQRYSVNQATVHEPEISRLEFTVNETGHFQNFQWRHLGQVSVNSAGTYLVKVSAKTIASGAAMDFRMLSLTRIPQ